MMGKECYEKMNSEIERRMCSADWDCTIASCVVDRHNQKVKRNIFTLSSFSLVATMAIIIFAVFINPPSGKMSDLEVFVGRQIEGTHKEVFKEGYLKNVNFYEDMNTPIDHLIDNALSTRL